MPDLAEPNNGQVLLERSGARHDQQSGGVPITRKRRAGWPAMGLDYTIYYVLDTIYYILHTIYCILYTIYCMPYTIYYILYTTYYIRYTIYYILCLCYAMVPALGQQKQHMPGQPD